MKIDYKLLVYLYNFYIKDKKQERFDIIHDFIAYKLPNLKGNIKEIKKSYINYLKDTTKYNVVIEDNKIRNLKKYEKLNIDDVNIEEEYEYDFTEKINIEQEGIEKIERIISYIKKLNSIDRELFKQYYINDLSIRDIAAKYNLKVWLVHKKLKKYKDDIRSLYEIDKNLLEIKLYINDLKNRDFNFTLIDTLKIINYHEILFRYKTDKYDDMNISPYQMIEDIIKEIKNYETI